MSEYSSRNDLDFVITLLVQPQDQDEETIFQQVVLGDLGMPLLGLGLESIVTRPRGGLQGFCTRVRV